MTPSVDDLKVINHGYCWANNFLFQFVNEERTHVSKFAILDWQVSKFTSPATDLSHFLFTSSKVSDKYTVETFFDEWRKYGRYGAVFCILQIKSFYSEKEDLPDMADIANKGAELGEAFKYEAKDKIGWKNRMKPIVEYAVKKSSYSLLCCKL
ncbi:hypothetical protein Zmor_023689 [Zophobas morio]|uniref:CHK kinase-like domain-containing protein n=1 Tax=Zophobas morio TaxID=2755281 RepID=A0AA38HXA6_9CUCU|nr:hypothetical protein Zmor_023689 [Zophobas morio]